MLKIQFKDGRSDAVTLEAPGKTIGKGKVNDIVVDADGVGGFHADLKVEGETVTLTDVAPDGGTLLNGDLLTGPTVVRAGDLINIKGVELEVVESDAAGEAGAKTLVLSGSVLDDVEQGWSLVAQSGPEKGQIIPIQGNIEIGRALECEISILEPALSRKHAELEITEDNEMVIRDLDSVNGTYVNGEKVEEVTLKSEDIIQFHKIRFLVKAP